MTYLTLTVMILLALALKLFKKQLQAIKKNVLTKLKDLKATVIK